MVSKFEKRVNAIYNKDYPTLIQMGENLLNTMIDVAIGYAKTKKILVDEEELERRAKICLVCFRYDSKKHRCKVCGCYSKIKNHLIEGKCKLNKW